ncbi:MAG: UDP-N-acetylmuramate--L-alanine ligase [bacterium ADurb.Bin212]|nr:MAG: UDP-N-acetylmuramate--L-alanine ligase [bacterium ADurb.Bin212]
MKYHFVGIKGVSMGALAEIVKSMGHEVSGSDIKLSGHSKSNISSDIDVLVRTSAVNQGSPGWVEVEEAERRGIRVIKRSELIAEITQDKKLIAVSGMHGKTTTTSLLGLIMVEAGLDPTVLVGEGIEEFSGRAYHLGCGEYFVLEACEYDRSFLDFHPEILLLTNIDEEHLDTYPGGLPEIKDAFAKYIENIKTGGYIVANGDDENIIEVLKSARKDLNIIWYGKKEYLTEFSLALKGEHNRSNASAVVLVCDILGISQDHIQKVFSRFKGANRRMQFWGEHNNSLLFDDYGHHPTEISATISALKSEYPGRKLNVIFWPHQYKRILPLIDKFSDSFSLADSVFIKDIYFVPGRDERLAVSSRDLADRINNNSNKAIVFTDDDEILDEIDKISREECVILTIGIPPIYMLLEKLISKGK